MNAPSSIVSLHPSFSSLVPRGTSVEKVAGDFTFVEGPMWRCGRLWFSDEEGDRVNAVTSDGKVELLVDYKSGPLAAPDGAKTGPNGMATAKDGSVVMAQQYGRRVVRLVERDGKVQPEPIFDSFEGKRLNSPNDLVFARDGSFYFTDPTYGLKGRDQDPAKEIPFQGVYRFHEGKLQAVIQDLPTPNGIALSPDGAILYVANSGPHMCIMRYGVQADGTLSEGHCVVEFQPSEDEGVPDGLKVDSLGNIWTTGPGGIHVVGPNGKTLGMIKLPEVPANLAWGDDGHSLYITARTSIYRVRATVAGTLPAFRH